MATFKVVAQKPPVPTPMQPGDFDLEMEALASIDAEIVELAAPRRRSSSRGRGTPTR